jgi:hypothetical protein
VQYEAVRWRGGLRASLAFLRWLLSHEIFYFGARSWRVFEACRSIVLPGDLQGVGGFGGEELCSLSVRLCSGLKIARVVSLSQKARSAQEIGLRIENVPWQ